MTHRPMLLAVPVLAAGLLLGGCTLGDDPAAGGASSAPAGGAGSSQEIGSTVDVLLASAGEESVDLSGDLPVVATRPASSSYGDFEVDLNGVAVRDELMTVVFTIRVTELSGSIFSVNDLFDDGTGRDDGADNASRYSTDGVYVLDPAAGTRHLVAYDSEDLCVCSTALNSRGGLEAGGSMTLASTFAAPPEGTTTVDVVIPSVGAFSGVALER